MKVYLDREIYWELLVLLLARIFLMNEQIFFVMTLAYFLLCVMKQMKFRIPQIAGFKWYMIFIMYSTIMGLVLYSSRNVIRDIYYIAPTTLWIIIGYNLCAENNMGKSMIRTLYLYGMIVSMKCLTEFLIRQTFDFNQIRIIFGTYVYDVGFLLPILAFELIILRITIFSKKIDYGILLLMLVQIGLSFGRIAILEPLIAFLVICVLSIFGLNYKGRTIKTITGIIMVLTVIVIVLFYVLPDSTTSIFIAKISNSVTEINTRQDIDSIATAMQNWRAYEMQAAWTQWKESSITAQIWGHGMGKGIELTFVPYNWLNAGIIVNGEIPLAHNGFYTLLPKGGIFAVISILSIFIGAICRGMCMLQRGNGELKMYGIILVSIMIAGFANMWVVRGAVCSDAFVVWGLLLGWIYAKGRNKAKWLMR